MESDNKINFGMGMNGKEVDGRKLMLIGVRENSRAMQCVVVHGE